MIGTTVGHYRVLDRIGGGGMGVLHRAEDVRLGRIIDTLIRRRQGREARRRSPAAGQGRL